MAMTTVTYVTASSLSALKTAVEAHLAANPTHNIIGSPTFNPSKGEWVQACGI